MACEIRMMGTLSDGRKIHLIKIITENGTYAEFSDFGAMIVSVFVKDGFGNISDVIAGFDTVKGLEEDTASMGKTVGRVANRISDKGINFDGKHFDITKNINGEFTLHGNHEYSKAVWNFKTGNDFVEFSYDSPNGAEGFPGKVENKVKFTFDGKKLEIKYFAKPSEKSPLNLTNHSYFNLGEESAEEHILSINADKITPLDKRLIPTGEFMYVRGTPLDFRMPKKIGEGISSSFEQIRLANGYDFNYVINDYNGELRPFAYVISSSSKRSMRVYTDLPGVQLYTGNFLDGCIGKGGKPIERRFAFCLETQFFPDTLNHIEFKPQNLFTPENPLETTTIFEFDVI
ncbi:MAG: aldose epimerase family protein [Candidatus Fimenecus sp.]